MADLFWLSDAQWAVMPFMPRNQPAAESLKRLPAPRQWLRRVP